MELLWTHEHPGFYERYARARDEGADRIAEMVLDALDDPNLPPEQVMRVRELTQARKWYASKIAPRRYADKLQVQQEISGVNGGPVEIRVQALLGLVEDPAIADRLSGVHLAAIKEVALLLSAPSPTVIDAEAVAVPSAGDAEK